MRSPATGFTVIPVDGEELETRFALMSGRIGYELGAKAKPSTNPDKIEKIDCSGFVLYLLERLCPGLGIPDGSQNQKAWCKMRGFKVTDYNAHAGLRDGRLRIGFLSPEPGEEWPRHVWLIYNGKTMESCKGKGVCRRMWSNRVFKGAACFVLTDVLT